jgi:hypothetical protein
MERISIGFAAGQVLALRVDKTALGSLNDALSSSDAWHQISTDEGDVSLRLDAVVYLRTEASGSKVGFGSS